MASGSAVPPLQVFDAADGLWLSGISASAPVVGVPLTVYLRTTSGLQNSTGGQSNVNAVLAGLVSQDVAGQAVVVGKLATASVSTATGATYSNVQLVSAQPVPASAAGKSLTVWVGSASAVGAVPVGANVLTAVNVQLLKWQTQAAAGGSSASAAPLPVVTGSASGGGTATMASAAIGVHSLPSVKTGQKATAILSVKNTGSATAAFTIDGLLEVPSTGANAGFWSYTGKTLAPGQEVFVTLTTLNPLPSAWAGKGLSAIFHVKYAGKILASASGTLKVTASGTSGSPSSSTPPTNQTPPPTTQPQGATQTILGIPVTATNVAIAAVGAAGVVLVIYGLAGRSRPRYGGTAPYAGEGAA